MRCVCACRPATGHDRGSPSCPDSSVQVHPNYVSWRCAVAFSCGAVARAPCARQTRQKAWIFRRSSGFDYNSYNLSCAGAGIRDAACRMARACAVEPKNRERLANGAEPNRKRNAEAGTRKRNRCRPAPGVDASRRESRDTKNYRNRPDLRRREVQYMHEPCAGSSLGRLSRCPGLHRPPRAPPHASLADATKVRFPSAMRSGASGDP